MEIFPIHHHRHYIDQCINILNEEWPKSVGFRRHMLELSNDSFPYSLVLVNINDLSPNNVVGHSRLVKVEGQLNASFVQSVVVCQIQRGKGFGSVLMQKTEEHAFLKLGIKTLYLTTHDKQEFYSHVGYNYCQPVNFTTSTPKIRQMWQDKLPFPSKDINRSSTSENMKSQQLNCSQVEQSIKDIRTPENNSNTKTNYSDLSQTEKTNDDTSLLLNVHNVKLECELDDITNLKSEFDLLDSECSDVHLMSIIPSSSTTSPWSPAPPPPPLPSATSHPAWKKNELQHKEKIYWMKKDLSYLSLKL